MTGLLQTCAVLLGVAALLLSAQGAAYALTEWRGPLIKIKPLNCRPCLTFWLTLLVALAAGEAARFAITLAFINYFYIITKIKIYE